MCDWYCVKRYPIPLDVPVLMRGIVVASIAEDEVYGTCEHLVEITEWQPLDGIEPKPKGENDE